jgi:hypothetical protein
MCYRKKVYAFVIALRIGSTPHPPASQFGEKHLPDRKGRKGKIGSGRGGRRVAILKILRQLNSVALFTYFS